MLTRMKREIDEVIQHIFKNLHKLSAKVLPLTVNNVKAKSKTWPIF